MNEATNMQHNNLVLMARGLAKTYGQGPTAVEVLKAIDLDVIPSEKVAIVGSSGSKCRLSRSCWLKFKTAIHQEVRSIAQSKLGLYLSVSSSLR